MISLAAWITVFAYFALMVYLISYLRKVHTTMWVQLGRPSGPYSGNPFDVISILKFFWTWLRTAGFILLTNQYATLNDPKLTKLIWSIRVLLLVGAFFVMLQRRLALL